MSEIDILKKQIEALRELTDIQERSIRELNAQILRLSVPQISITSQWEVPACVHDFPSPWYGTVPPNCKKCGQQAASMTVTCIDGISDTKYFVR